MVHLATMIAIIIVYRKTIKRLLIDVFSLPRNISREGFKNAFKQKNIRFVIAIIIGTIPAFFIGFYLRDWFTIIENNLLVVGFMFLITALFLLLSKLFDKVKSDDNEESIDKKGKVKIKQGFIIGIAQAAAIMPGISRSGATITTGRILGLDRETAASFSFIMSLPVILGASALELVKAIENGLEGINILGVSIGFIMALVVGWISLVFLLKFIKKGKFYYFGFYVLLVSIVCFILYFNS
jgi:undecaprenyl-diphosphatase